MAGDTEAQIRAVCGLSPKLKLVFSPPARGIAGLYDRLPAVFTRAKSFRAEAADVRSFLRYAPESKLKRTEMEMVGKARVPVDLAT